MQEAINSKFIQNDSVKDVTEFPNSFDNNNIIVYEVVRLIDGRILFLDDHLERFFTSLEHINQPISITKDAILNQIQLLVTSNNNIPHGNIKFQNVFKADSGQSDFYTFYINHSYPTDPQYKEGVPILIVPASRNNPNAKVHQPKLRDELNLIIKFNNVYEVILVHPEGYITEGSRSNFFMIKNNTIVTAGDPDVLQGIMRKYVIQLCGGLNIPVHFERVTVQEMMSMDALFLTGTSPKILPISMVSGKFFDVSHPILRKVMEEFNMFIKKNIVQSRNFIKN